ncbi:NADP-dependent oxidoreductase [Flavobacterium rhizosphaerae]|uniref:NADP-dependent oxidoreductase n=1 Tax=Flavobacterium rhizosphaerae TaxID=3163298 RepID=A0ABW8YS57_9FLAO
MKAIILDKPGQENPFTFADIPVPDIKPDEVLIQVKAISINPVDVKTASGGAFYNKLQQESPVIAGWDVSGIITQTGADVKTFKTGDEVFGMVNFPGSGKAYAEYVAAPAAHLAHKPANISFEQAAATTLAALTAWQDLQQAGVTKGHKLLVHAASGGVGHFAVQLAKHLGAYVIGVSSTENKDFVLALGADEHIDYKEQDFEKEVGGVDVAIDIVGGDNIPRNLTIIKPGGTLVSNLGIKDEVAAAAKDKEIKTIAYLVHSSGDDMKTLADLLEKGTLTPHIFKTFSFTDINNAHKQVATSHTVGKVIVTF